MKVNFDKTDHLIEVISKGLAVLDESLYKGAYELKNHNNPQLRKLYYELIEITQDDIPEAEKQQKREMAFAKAYNEESGKELLKITFDEKEIVGYLTAIYWSFPVFYIKDEYGNRTNDTDIITEYLLEQYPQEPYPGVMINTFCETIPTIKDIENEFWGNCPDVNNINYWCDIYRNRFKGKLKALDLDYYKSAWIGDNNNLLHQYFSDLRLTGLLKKETTYAELRLYHIARSLQNISDEIIQLFKRIRRNGNTEAVINIKPHKEPQAKEKVSESFQDDDETNRIFMQDGYRYFQELNESWVRKRAKRKDYSLLFWEFKRRNLIYKRVGNTEFTTWLRELEHLDNTVEQLYAETATYTEDRKGSLSTALRDIK